MPRKPVHHRQAQPETLSYADLPPPSPQEREELIARIKALYDRVNAVTAAEERERLLSMVHLAP